MSWVRQYVPHISLLCTALLDGLCLTAHKSIPKCSIEDSFRVTSFNWFYCWSILVETAFLCRNNNMSLSNLEPDHLLSFLIYNAYYQKKLKGSKTLYNIIPGPFVTQIGTLNFRSIIAEQMIRPPSHSAVFFSLLP